MRYLSIYKMPEEKAGVPPTPEMQARMGKLIEQGVKAGTLVTTDGISNPKRSARVKRGAGKVTVTDGPFTEAKELVAGFAIFEVRSREHAIELAEEFLQYVEEGTCELHELFGPPPDAAKRG
jgi:hypothetical protein